MPKDDKVNTDLFGTMAMRAYVSLGIEGRERMRKRPVERGMYATNRDYIRVDDSQGIGIPAWSKLVVSRVDAEAQLVQVWYATGIGGHYVWVEPRKLITFEKIPFFGGRQ